MVKQIEPSEQQRIRRYRQTIKQSYDIWNKTKNDSSKLQSGNAGSEMNWLRSQIIFCKEQLVELANRNHMPIPEECFMATPPAISII